MRPAEAVVGLHEIAAGKRLLNRIPVIPAVEFVRLFRRGDGEEIRVVIVVLHPVILASLHENEGIAGTAVEKITASVIPDIQVVAVGAAAVAPGNRSKGIEMRIGLRGILHEKGRARLCHLFFSLPFVRPLCLTAVPSDNGSIEEGAVGQQQSAVEVSAAASSTA